MKGHALRGIFGGFFTGLFLPITLWIYGAIPFASDLMWILPLVGIVIGLILAAWAPFGRGKKEETASTEGVSYASAGDAESSGTSGTTLEQDTIDIELKPADEPPDPSDG